MCNATLAQLVAQLFCTQKVGSSSLSSGNIRSLRVLDGVEKHSYTVSHLVQLQGAVLPGENMFNWFKKEKKESEDLLAIYRKLDSIKIEIQRWHSDQSMVLNRLDQLKTTVDDQTMIAIRDVQNRYIVCLEDKLRVAIRDNIDFAKERSIIYENLSRKE